MRRAETSPNRNNSGTGIDRLIIYFDEKTYNPGKQLFMSYRDSKEKYDFMKAATNVKFSQMYAMAGIEKLEKNKWQP